MAVHPEAAADPLIGRLKALRSNIGRVFLGNSSAITEVLVGLLSRGHVLIEDVPGVGKTVLARALATSLKLSFARVQLTPDLLPSDIIGVSIYDAKSGAFEFKRGPVFANIVLADEINRTTPRTQSALLEAMNEAQVSVDGRTIKLERPFMVIATQNPFEFEGTYFLPENQLDRFAVRIRIGYPSREFEMQIIREQPGGNVLEDLEPVMSRDDVIALQDRVARIHVEDRLINYALDLVEVTRGHEQIEVGISPRGAISLIRCAQALALLMGREYVIPDDVKSLFVPTCAHRIVTKSYLQDGHTVNTDQLLGEIVRNVTMPD